MRVKLAITAMLLLALAALGSAASAFAALPDGRGYELVSPVDKNSNDVENANVLEELHGVAGATGTGFSFFAMNGLPGAESGALESGYVSTRDVTGWTTEGVSPPETSQNGASVGKPTLWSRDLSKALVASRRNLTGDAPSGSYNLFVRTAAPREYQLVTSFPNEQIEYSTEGMGSSADFSRLFFSSAAPLTADAPNNGNLQLFEWTATGGLKDVGLLPGATTPNGSRIEMQRFATNVVSEAGAVVYDMPSAAGPVAVFRREGGVTVEVSAPNAGVVDPAGPQPATFVGAPADGSAVFFVSAGKLTADANTGTNDSSPNLYRYDVADGELEDLTVTAASGGPVVANVLVSNLGNDAYFVAKANLAGAATAGQPNLYRWSTASGVEFIAALSAGDPFAGGFAGPIAATSAEGSALIFTSEAGLAGNLAAAGVREIYRWKAGEGLACVSCSDAPATGAQVTQPTVRGGAGGNPISSDGSRVFFNTADPLVAADTDGVGDVYEWNDGEVGLLTSGKGTTESKFIDADPSGIDAFFATRDQLVGADVDQNTDVYDARIGGGFAEPEAPAPPCEGEACRPAPEASPSTPATASSTFVGPHNLKPKHPRKKPKHKRKHHPKPKQKHSKKRQSAGKRG